MYQGFAAYKNWDFEIFNYTPAEFGLYTVYILLALLETLEP